MGIKLVHEKVDIWTGPYLLEVNHVQNSELPQS